MSLRDSGRLVHEELRRAAEARGDFPWLRFSAGGVHTLGEVRQRASQLAGGLLELGVNKGDRVALLIDNRVEFIESWFATHMIGAIVVPLNTALRGTVLTHVMELSSPRVLISLSELVPRVRDALGSSQYLETIVVVRSDSRAEGIGSVIPYEALSASELKETRDIRPWDPSAIMFTSGTTGPSKGVIYSHNNTYWIAETCVRYLKYTERDILYTSLPLFHANALNTSTFPSLLARARIVVGPRFSVSSFWDRVQESGATATNLLGAMTPMLLRQDPHGREKAHQLRTGLVIPSPKEFYDQIPERFGFDPVEAYGLSDFGMLLWPPRDEPARPGSCGIPTEGFECRLFDEHDEEVAPGEVGELVARPLKPWITPLGYWEMPEATVAAYRNLWFHTGDLMVRDEDGWFYYVDRDKDAIRRRGENVSSFEVEQAVLLHQDVEECAAYAVPSELSEDEIAIAVVLRPESKLVAQELIEFVEQRLPYFAVPRYVRFVEKLPMTQTEKVRKRTLRDEGITTDMWDREESGYQVKR